jgi:hypothetical protein
MNENIKLFDVFTSAILNKLYNHFPKCVEVLPDTEVEELIKKLKEFSSTNFTEKTVTYAETMFWLKSNGYINFIYPDERPQIPANISQFDCVELTKEGLKLLKSPSPKALKAGVSVGDEIADRLKAGLLNEAGKIALHAILY